MRIDRALRRIARFSDPQTWHPNLQRSYAEMMLRRFGRVIDFVPRETFAGGVVPSVFGSTAKRRANGKVKMADASRAFVDAVAAAQRENDALGKAVRERVQAMPDLSPR
jgi:hypothetical protein